MRCERAQTARKEERKSASHSGAVWTNIEKQKPCGKTLRAQIQTLIKASIASARDPAGASRHESTISVYGGAEERSSAAKYRFQSYRCPKGRVGCDTKQIKFRQQKFR